MRNSHDSCMVDYWTRRDKGKKERDVNEFSREENAPVNCCTLHCAVRAQLLCVSKFRDAAPGTSIFCTTVPLYRAFCMGKQLHTSVFWYVPKKKFLVQVIFQPSVCEVALRARVDPFSRARTTPRGSRAFSPRLLQAV